MPNEETALRQIRWNYVHIEIDNMIDPLLQGITHYFSC